MTAAGCEVPLYFDRLAPCLYLTDVGMLSQQRGLYVTCRQKDFSNKFYTLDYIDIEFDLLTEVADVDHANYFTRQLFTLRPPTIYKKMKKIRKHFTANISFDTF